MHNTLLLLGGKQHTTSVTANTVVDERIRQQKVPHSNSTSFIPEPTETSHRLTIRDPTTNIQFLIDSGSDVSIIATQQRRSSTGTKLYAANGTPIDTFGHRLENVSLGLRRIFSWPFILANTSTSIIGADFLHKFGLLVDIRGRRLTDSMTHLSVKCESIFQFSTSVHTIAPNTKYKELLLEFIDITQPTIIPKISEHDTSHYIETNCRPVTARFRRLSPTRLQIAKAEFQKMIDMGICRPSKSPWASPLHLVKKPTGEFRLVGAYRSLNSKTVADQYPIPHLHDFNHPLAEKTIFSTLEHTTKYQFIRTQSQKRQ